MTFMLPNLKIYLRGFTYGGVMNNLTLYRKRLIPDECILLKDDIIVHADNDVIVTTWHSLKKRKDIGTGISLYLMNQGIKASKFYSNNGDFLYWYCDVVDYVVDKEANSVTTIDLLADVIVYPNYFVKVMDLDELSEAHKTGLINDDQLHKALEITNILVSGDVKENFDRFQIIIDKYIDNM